MYNEKDWYWIVNGSGSLFSSGKMEFVSSDDGDYFLWRGKGFSETIISERDLTLKRIQWLEQLQTSRRIREAILGLDNGWLQGIDEQIASLRETL